jgi:hypothetical protein
VDLGVWEEVSGSTVGALRLTLKKEPEEVAGEGRGHTSSAVTLTGHLALLGRLGMLSLATALQTG